MAKTILIFFVVPLVTTLAAQPLCLESGNLEVVWNVGQGQWFTRIEAEKCLHFDAGGEFSALQHVTPLCQNKTNQLFLSHWDWDHLSFVGSLKRRFSKLCLINIPPGEASLRKQKMLEKIPLCQERISFLILDRPTKNYVSKEKHRSNDLSQVAISRGWLLPGDAPTQNERRWLQRIPVKKIKFILLGHHGSSTSTSPQLLMHLKNLKMAVASSRQARYGHPHQEVRRRLFNAKIPLLRTEDWGHIGFSSP